MNLRVYLKAFTTGPVANPEVCLIRFTDETALRLRTLASMVKEFNMETVTDRQHATWRDSIWESHHALCTPQLVTTAKECWWATEVLTDGGSFEFQTERVSIEKLIDACERCDAAVLHYTEQNPDEVKKREQSFGD
jgi:hypothetical protein